MIRVFLSSTMADLHNERQAVADAIRKLDGFQLVLLEEPESKTVWLEDEIRGRIAEADVMVLMLGPRAGWVSGSIGTPVEYRVGSGKRSTKGSIEVMPLLEAEYNLAIACGKPVLVFVSREEERVRDEFRCRVMEEHSVVNFDTPEQLASRVVEGLRVWQRETAASSGPGASHAFEILFAPQLMPEQVEGCLNALADYYRGCGGVGFEPDFELADVLIQEPADVLA